MKRQRKDISKNTKYLLLFITLLIGEIGSIVTKSASVIELVSLDLVVLAPILIKRFKYDTDPGRYANRGTHTYRYLGCRFYWRGMPS